MTLIIRKCIVSGPMHRPAAHSRYLKLHGTFTCAISNILNLIEDHDVIGIDVQPLHLATLQCTDGKWSQGRWIFPKQQSMRRTGQSNRHHHGYGHHLIQLPGPMAYYYWSLHGKRKIWQRMNDSPDDNKTNAENSANSVSVSFISAKHLANSNALFTSFISVVSVKTTNTIHL